MLIAVATRERAECLGRHVGAVLIREGRIVATGYNGTPRGFPRCNESERGCHRCAHREQYPSGAAYDVCICVHAEQNASCRPRASATRWRARIATRRCGRASGAVKELRQAGAERVVYLNAWAARRARARGLQRAARPAGSARDDRRAPRSRPGGAAARSGGAAARREQRAVRRPPPIAALFTLLAAGLALIAAAAWDGGAPIRRSPQPSWPRGWRHRAAHVALLSPTSAFAAPDRSGRDSSIRVVPITHRRHSPPLMFEGALAWLPKASLS